MMRFKKPTKEALLKVAVLTALSASASVAIADTNDAATTPTIVNNTAASDWKFNISPYIWAISMNGDVQVASEKIHIAEPFNNLWHKIDFAGMLWLDAYYKERYGIFLNSLYAHLTDNVYEDGIKVNSTANFTLITGGASYKAYITELDNGKSRFEIEPYIGARFTQNNVSLDLPAFNSSFSDNQNWTDPIAGVRFNYFFNQNWLANFSADAGGTNMSSDTSYNLNALFGYHPTSTAFLKHTTFYVGYRYLQQHYETGSGINKFEWQMKLYGPVAGVSINL